MALPKTLLSTSLVKALHFRTSTVGSAVLSDYEQDETAYE